MNPIEIVVLDQATLPDQNLNLDFPHHITAHDHTNADQVSSRIAKANIIVTNKVKIDANAIRNSPNLQLIAVAATGYEHVNLKAAQECGVVVCNIRAYGNDTVAEHAFMLMIALMRQLPAYQRDVAAGLWQSSPFFCYFGAPIRDLNGKILGIFGRGGIGQALAQRAEAFGMTILWGEHKHANGCRDGYVPFDEVLQKADVISLHCPLNNQTRHMISSTELQNMKSRALLINVGRGGLVDEQALLDAITYGQLAGAGVDVLTEEPPQSGNPLLSQSLPNLIVTPHMAWGSEEAMQRLFGMLQDNINAFVQGKPQNVVG